MAGKPRGIPPMLLRTTEAARALALHPQTLANLRLRGDGPEYVKIGTAVRYEADALRQFVESHTKKNTRRVG